VLRVGTADDPVAGPGEVVIKVGAAGVNPVDAKIRRGMLRERIPHELPIIPGWDAAGEVVETGKGVDDLSPGDPVFAYCRKPVVQYGAYAAFIALPATSVARRPANLSVAEAASVPLAALTAWQSLFDAAGLRAGQTVLIHAGAGGVGGFAIQLAKHAGARVLATASAANHALVRSYGADEVIDYTEVDFREAVRAACPGGVDVAYDTVGGEVQARSAEVVRRAGVLVSILAFADEAAVQALGVQTRYVFVAPNRGQLGSLAGLIEQGVVRPRLADILPLEDAAEAHRRIETGHTAGKLVLMV
jgi:NADPH2:quinone reductase